jgi:hypothetical protein
MHPPREAPACRLCSVAVRERLIQLARRLQERSWNRPDTDKTWVLQAMWQQRLFMREVQRASPVADA